MWLCVLLLVHFIQAPDCRSRKLTPDVWLAVVVHQCCVELWANLT